MIATLRFAYEGDMSWLPKREKLDPVQVSAIDFVVAKEGKRKVAKVGGGGDAESGTGRAEWAFDWTAAGLPRPKLEV